MGIRQERVSPKKGAGPKGFCFQGKGRKLYVKKNKELEKNMNNEGQVCRNGV